MNDSRDVALAIHGLRVEVGGTVAVKDVSLQLPVGASLGLLGGNGSGKTSLFNAVCGLYPTTDGRIELFGEDLRSLRTDQIVRRGVGRSLQSVAQIVDLTAAEYVALGVSAAKPRPFFKRAAPLPRTARFEREVLQEARSLLDELELGAYADVPLQDAPYGARKLADVVRAFASRPRVVLLDEPTSGVGSDHREALAAMVRGWCDRRGASVLLIDHDVDFVMSICPDIVVLSAGEVLAHGEAGPVLADEHVVRDFLGIAAEA
jgi:branched-chain amino acid transport system ATP-binding protein